MLSLTVPTLSLTQKEQRRKQTLMNHVWVTSTGTACGLNNSMANYHTTAKIQESSTERKNKGDMVYSAIFNVQPRPSVATTTLINTSTHHRTCSCHVYCTTRHEHTPHCTPLEETVFGVPTGTTCSAALGSSRPSLWCEA